MSFNATLLAIPSPPVQPSSSMSSTSSLNSDDLQRQLDTTRLIVQKILVPAVVTFGITGNVVNVANVRRRSGALPFHGSRSSRSGSRKQTQRTTQRNNGTAAGKLQGQTIQSDVTKQETVVDNVVNVAVLTRRWMKSSTNSYLTALAVPHIYHN